MFRRSELRYAEKTMHELPITEGILKIAIDVAGAHNAARVNAIYLTIGELTSIVDDSVQFYFDFLSKDTIAEGAQLHFRREPAIAVCQDCAHQFAATPPLLPECPTCGSAQIAVSGGKEFFVESIDID